jgi:negative regulator of sigma E activity
MKIDRHNYEEFFVLYMDNELNSEDRRQVEAFIQLHPDLKEELELLLQFKLVPDENIVFAGKEELQKADPSVAGTNGESPITLTNYEEWFTLYTDDELTTGQKWAVEQFIAENPFLEKELVLFQKSKLQQEEIVFADKESLYRREEKVRAMPVRWWRIAAAAILILGIGFGTYSVLKNKKSSIDKDNMANTGKENTNPGNQVVTPEVKNINVPNPLANDNNRKEVSPDEQTNAENKSVQHANNNTARNNNVIPDRKNNNNVAPVPVKKEEPVLVNNNDNQPSNNLPQPDNNPYLKPMHPKDAIADAGTQKENVKLGTSSEDGVTIKTSPPSNIVQATFKEDDAAFENSDGKKNKLRGFFRKVTRTFDKRTTNDDDDKLLVAGLSIKLR